jgi:hypothetical protein
VRKGVRRQGRRKGGVEHTVDAAEAIKARQGGGGRGVEGLKKKNQARMGTA